MSDCKCKYDNGWELFTFLVVVLSLLWMYVNNTIEHSRIESRLATIEALVSP